MRMFNIGQKVWVHKPELLLRNLKICFFASSIKQITTSETQEGILILYLLSNGDVKKEEELFSSKEDVIDYVIAEIERFKDE